MAEENSCEVLVLGAGPAGIQASIHAARRGASVVITGRPSASALMRAHIENYAFVPGVAKGEELLRMGLAQATGFGARHIEEDVLELAPVGGEFSGALESGRELRARAVIFATGAARRRLGVPGEKELEGRGVSYCTDCDAGFFKKKRVVMVGDGSAAASGALQLTRFASSVMLVYERMEASPELLRRLPEAGVEMVGGVKVSGILGRETVEGVALSDGRSIPADGVFIERGARGVLELGAALGLALGDDGSLAVNRGQATSAPGVFAAGDVTGPPYQLAKAVGEGCVAGIMAAEFAKRGGEH
ncbi:MAG: NAD(P)/FAD-dependent oxidoreductase [Thermoplasmatota archaeon]